MNYFPVQKPFTHIVKNLKNEEIIESEYLNTNMYTLILVEAKKVPPLIYINNRLKEVNKTIFVLFIYKDQPYKIEAKGDTNISLFYFDPIKFFKNKNKVEISTLKIHDYTNFVYQSIFTEDEEYYKAIIYLTKAAFSLLETNNNSLLINVENTIFEIIKLIEKEMLYIGYKQLPYQNNRDLEDITPCLNAIQKCLEDGELDISIDDLASAANMSKITLIRKFKKVFDITPYQYLLERKIHYSTQLLIKTNVSINEIAMNLGYSTVYAYELSFKKIFNTSPSAYRKENKIK